MRKKEKEIGEQQLRELERVVMLKIVDDRWMDHIDAMDELKRRNWFTSLWSKKTLLFNTELKDLICLNK